MSLLTLLLPSFLLGPRHPRLRPESKSMLWLCNQSMWSHTFHDIRSDRSNPRSRRDSTCEAFHYVGGGLGSVPSQAKLLEEFVPEHELLPLSQTVCRVFARLGEKNHRTRARMKFLVNKVGIEEFRELVRQEREILPHDERWVSTMKQPAHWFQNPLAREYFQFGYRT